MAIGHKLHYIIPSYSKGDFEIDFEHANPEYASNVRRDSCERVVAIMASTVQNSELLNKAATVSSASQIVFGSIFSSIKHVVESFSSKAKELVDKGKGEEFDPFVVGGSIMANAIEIVEVEDD